MLKAILFENEAGEWFIDHSNPEIVRGGPFYSLGEAKNAYHQCYPENPKAYLVRPYLEQTEGKMAIVNPISIKPNELKAGDVMMCTVTLHVLAQGDKLAYRMYLCPVGGRTVDGVPQGSRIGGEAMPFLFPVVGWAKIKADLG